MPDRVTEAAVLDALRKIEDPDLHRDIVSLGFIKDMKIDGGKVSFTIAMTTPACPVREKFQAEARAHVSQIPGVGSVDVRMTSQVRPSQSEIKNQLIPGVRNVVPVASGKGGVGKSTVSANLAVALAQMGARVGLMDADIYGPSIPMIMGVTEGPEIVDDRRIIPPAQNGVKIISMGFFLQEKEAVIWRGPMLIQMIRQFLGDVEWGDLDYLVVDLPPGTGDIQLSLCQTIPLTGAVIVSTPQDVALKVAQKAIALFQKLNCPVLGIIENMSHYVCRKCGERDDIFGSGGARRAAVDLDVPFLGDIPLATEIRTSADDGRPILLSDPDSPYAKAFLHAAENVAAQISIQNMSGAAPVKITF
ncbi:MAG: chromosome partitioning protein [Candidatus Lindowbacteria bacterium RIFCSPLOWO2_02_FULL_62_12]|nr:MAG: chromosome partitioning protein [Candidatus Lindowbacteria bacterium RIFCSPLOWO2_02_FULL_62_12]